MCSAGAATGSICCGFFMKYGKKNIILAANFFVILGASICLAENTTVIIIGRFIYGMAAGIFSVAVPGFFNELCPTELKGALGGSIQILLNTGILIASALGLVVPDITKDEDFIQYKDSF